MNPVDPPPSQTDLDLWQLVENEPEGTFRLYKADGVGTEERIQQHLSNSDELEKRLTHAVESKCVIEVISLRLQVIDFWLRMYYSNRAPKGSVREREFGRLIKQCFDLGMPESLYLRLKTFNARRVDAIHGYVVGSTSYDALVPVAEATERLLKDVVIFVVSHSGTVVTSRNQIAASPGAMVICVEAFCETVEAGLRY